MKKYLDVMSKILLYEYEKVATRGEATDIEMPTIGLPNVHFSHDLAVGFPLITTRRIDYKQTFGELRAFLKGATFAAQFEDAGCNFWKPWAKKDGSLGPIYGHQWRAHGQLDHVLQCLRDRPTDRRMVVSAWRPDEHKDMALPPCHLMWVVTPYNGRLNLSWIQRSCDWPVGVPHNIASYALLAHLLAKWAGMKPGKIDCIFCDAHIYKNQMGLAKKQTRRCPRPFPRIQLFASPTDFFDWDASVLGYNPHPPMKYEVTV